MNWNIKKLHISPTVLIVTILLTLSPLICIAQPESVVLEGTVQFSDTGEPAEGAVVWAVYQDERAVQKIIYGPTFTDAAGDYRLEVPAGEKLLRMMATAKGYQSDSRPKLGRGWRLERFRPQKS
jgi:hypothetical protein